MYGVHVIFQDAFAQERTTAEFANEGSLFYVSLSVVLESSLSFVSFIALVAFVTGNLATVAAFVLDKVRPERVLGAADCTNVLSGFIASMA